MQLRFPVFTIVAAAALAVGGCGSKAPEGQVVATVDGQEVTLQELNAEAQAANVPENADKAVVQPQLLQQVINRKLLAAAARDKNMDENGEFLVQRRRAEEALLGQMFLKQQVASVGVPKPAEITKFIADNPTAFAQRTRYTLDQIRFQRPADANQLKAMEKDKTMAEVAATLTQLGIKFERGNSQIDSGTIPPDLMQRILALPAGEPFVIPEGPLIYVSVITGRQPVATPDAEARAAAANAIRQQGTQKALRDQLETLRKNAKIEYQKGFTPPADTPAGAPNAANTPAGGAPGSTSPAARP